MIVSSSGFAHHIDHPRSFIYCHTPPRFLYEMPTYRGSRALASAIRLGLPLVRSGDQEAARRALAYAANSSAAARRITQHYGRASTVIHPPMWTGHLPVTLTPPPSEPRALVVARLLGYKRVDVAIQACALAGVPLTVVGSGPHEE